MLDKYLLDILVCPICKGQLHYLKEKSELVCKLDRFAFPIKDDIPVLIDSQARELSLEELDDIK